MPVLASLTALVGRAAHVLLPGWSWPLRKPPQGQACAPTSEVRAAVLDALRGYLAAIELVMPDGRRVSFGDDDIYVAAADDNDDLALPALGFGGGQGEDELLTLGPPDIDDDTWGCAGPGTALVHIGDYRERLTVELWTSTDPERRAIIDALRLAFRPAEDTGTLLLPLAAHHGEIARYTLAGTQNIEDGEAVRNRRRVLLMVDVEARSMRLVGAVRMQPTVRVEEPDDCP